MAELLLGRRRMVVFLALFMFVVVLLTTQFRSSDQRAIGPLGSLVLTALLPVQAGMVRIAESGESLWRQFTEIGRLRVENARLRAQVDALSREAASLREDAAATARLERLLELRDAVAYRSVPSRVITRDPSRWFNTLTVDRGGRDGVTRNSPVVTPDGIVGRVIEVTATASRVLLIADSRSALGILLQDSRAAGVVEGRGSQRLHLKYLSRTAVVKPGARVVTSGLGGIFPRGLVVGRVVSVTREEGALLQEAEVEPAAALDRLEEVLILLPRH
jgi:rod shape-determining protein MreC